MSENQYFNQVSGKNGAQAAAAQEAVDLFVEEQRAKTLATRYRLPYIDLTQTRIDQELLRVLPVELMVQYRFVPIKREDDQLLIAVADPSELERVDEIRSRLREKIKLGVATAAAIGAILARGDASQRVLDETTEHLRVSLVKETEQGEEDLDLDRLTGDREMSPIVKLIDSVVLTALERRASDIHVETGSSEVVMKYRVDGVLYPAGPPIDIQHHQTIISRIKVMSELDIAERRVPQDGRFRVRVRGRTIDFRVSIMPTIHGEDAVIRILDKEQISEKFRDLRLDVLGFDSEVVRRLRRFIKEPYGMILVTGPTGSGKTTTLYAAINEIRTGEDKIITIEDPVEYQLREVTQIQVNEKKGLTFARGLRSILRHDPDKIMVGEIRDPETAQIAIQSALTGHLVFTTVHANNVIDVIGRFLNMGVEPYNFVGALNCVFAQRLVRVLCASCKRPYRATDGELVESGLEPEKYREQMFYDTGGCEQCNWTGYRGRTGIHELLDLTDSIREMIIGRKPGSEIRRVAQAEGLVTLRESAVKKVLDGITTLREINRVTFVE